MSDLPLLPPHIFRGLLESGRVRDLDLPQRVAEWVEQVLRADRWSAAVCMGHYGLTDRDVRIRVDVDVVVKGRRERAAGELVFRPHDDFAPRGVIDTMTRDLARLGATPWLDL